MLLYIGRDRRKEKKMIDIESLLDGTNPDKNKILETYHYYNQVIRFQDEKPYTYIYVDDRKIDNYTFNIFRIDLSRAGAQVQQLSKGNGHFWAFVYFGDTLEDIQKFFSFAQEAYDRINEGVKIENRYNPDIYPCSNLMFHLFLCANVMRPIPMTLREYKIIHTCRYLWENQLRTISIDNIDQTTSIFSTLEIRDK